MDRYLLSIIVVTFNNDEGLMRTLKSIANARGESSAVEIIVVDGGEGTVTKQIIKDNRFVNLILLKEPDDGIFDAMNKGFMLASGKWINYLNAGDVFNPELKLNLLTNQLANLNTIWVVGNAQIYVKNLLCDWLPGEVNHFKFQLGLNSFPHQATFYQRSKIIEYFGLPFCSTNSVADWSLSYELLIAQEPHLLRDYISINEEAGNSRNIPLIVWAIDIIKTRKKLKKLLTKNTTGDFLLQVSVGALSRIKNRL